jgi:DNA-binding transcriptional MerR regulator
MRSSSHKRLEPVFSRGDVAKILNVTPLTIANRENRNQYPRPKRDLNNYRIYTLNDVFNLQLLTFQHIDTRPILSLLYDKGYHDAKETTQIVDRALARRKGQI